MKLFVLPLAAVVSLLPGGAPSRAGAESFLSPDAKARTFVFRRHPRQPDVSKAVPFRQPVDPRVLPTEIELAIAAAKFRPSAIPEIFPGDRGADPETKVEAAFPDAKVQKSATANGNRVHPDNYGSSGQLYTMAEASGVKAQPYRRAGLLFLNDGGSSPRLCSAALIKPGIAVTAAHCIAPFGSRTSYTDFVYLPAYGPTSASSYGAWNATSVMVLSSWSDGTDACSVPKKVCQDDIGFVTLEQQNGMNLGDLTGYFGYAINGYSFSEGIAEITQLAYATGYDGGTAMLRVDAAWTVNPNRSNNTIMGSPLGDGSDGGPWVVNLGTRPKPTNGWSFGSAAKHDVIVGVTSWSTGQTSPKQQAGASPFLSTNIRALVDNACSATPSAC